MPTTPYPAPSGLTDATGAPITAGSWFHMRQWPRPAKWGPDDTDLYSCFIWRLEQTSGGEYILVAYGEKKRLRFTDHRSRELIAFSPSVKLYMHEYPLEWQRWLASGIGVLTRGGRHNDYCMSLFTRQGHTGFNLLDRGWKKPYTRAEISWWLMESLYKCYHLYKAADIEDREGEEMLRQSVLKFIGYMERREAKGLSSLPEKKPRSKDAAK